MLVDEVEEGLSMKRILVVGCSMVLALIVMDTTQVVKTPSGLTMRLGQALAADMPMPPPMVAPVAAPVGKGKAPIGKGKGKGPIVTRG
jgi:hypothetical protein